MRWEKEKEKRGKEKENSEKKLLKMKNQKERKKEEIVLCLIKCFNNMKRIKKNFKWTQKTISKEM